LGESIAVDPPARFAYVGNGAQLYAFSIVSSRSGIAGSLVPIIGAAFSYAADYVAVEVTGKFLFMVSTSANAGCSRSDEVFVSDGYEPQPDDDVTMQ